MDPVRISEQHARIVMRLVAARERTIREIDEELNSMRDLLVTQYGLPEGETYRFRQEAGGIYIEPAPEPEPSEE